MDSNSFQDQIDNKLREGQGEGNEENGTGANDPPPQGTNTSDNPEEGGRAETSGTNNQTEDPPQNPNSQPAKKQPKGKARAKSVGLIQIKPLTRQQEQIKAVQEREAEAQARLFKEREVNERAAKRIQELEKMLEERKEDESEGGEDEMEEDEEGGNIRCVGSFGRGWGWYSTATKK